MTDTVTTWTTCLKITTAAGTVIGLTELGVPLSIAGVVYLSASGYTPTTFSSDTSLAVSNADVEGLLSVAGIERAAIRAGEFDNAAIELFIYDYVAATVIKTLATGNWGQSTLHDGRFVAEFRSLSQRLQQQIGRIYTVHCTAELGDSRCGVDTSVLAVTGTLDSMTSRQVIVDAARTEAADAWRGGVLEFTSGANLGRRYEVDGSTDAGVLTLFLPLAYDAAAGDTYSLTPGCDKSLATCRDVYDNVINHRGFPGIPGQIEILRVGKSGKYRLPTTSTDPDAPDGTPSDEKQVYWVETGHLVIIIQSDDLTEPSGTWTGARLEFTSGPAAGLYAEVTLHDGLYLTIPTPAYMPDTGNTFTLTL